MQNQQYPLVPRNGQAAEQTGFLRMSEILHVSFEELMGHSETHAALEPPSHERATQHFPGDPTSIIYSSGLPHVDFSAIHALQGTSRPGAGYGSGVFELMPHNPGRVTRGVRSHVLRRLHKRMTPGEATNECHICMEVVQPGTQATELPCQHLFCAGCIREWLKNNDTCPVCRYKFPEDQTYLTNVQDS